ncbi:hypothetical protein M9H77_31214 [Catharanthus roseus]|uniref:Uncharacterized protein n=1 Tax=Catharanthus roseus TaxID=4058 RepID=A0ACB9ZZI3_CATRO|nr:hypothetical protein M9H77_31214 [Catharanthus roseus]
MNEKEYEAGLREEGCRPVLEGGGGLRECASGGPEEGCGPAWEGGGGLREFGLQEGVAGGPWEGAFRAGFAGGSGPWVGGLREAAGVFGLCLLFAKLSLSCILCCLEPKTCSPKL